MAIQWVKRISVITTLLLFSGCSIFTRSQSPEKAMIDPFVGREKAFQYILRYVGVEVLFSSHATKV